MGAIYLIRHGQASFGKADYDQLSETGFHQAKVLGAALRARVPRPDAVYSGTMRRHRETAEACLAAMAVAAQPVEAAGYKEYDHDEIVLRFKPEYADHAFREADLKRHDNPRRAFQQIFTQAIGRWVSGQHDADYGESWLAFRARCTQALDETIRQLGPSKTALVFTSGGPITAIAQNLLQIPDEHAFGLNWTLANCGVTKIIYSERGKYLSSLNEHAHFEGALRELITYR